MLPEVKLKELLEKWKERLRLRDWLVVTKLVDEDKDEDGMKKCAGRADIHPSVFEAVIELNSKLPSNDVEETIYHELAHIQVRYIFWNLRQVIRDMEDGEESDDEVSTLEMLLDSCEEEQVRHIEFLISRILGKKRYVARKKLA